VINDALKLGSDNNFGHDWMADFESRFQIKARNPITTGWERMDGFCKGGLGKSELGVVIAPTGAGKSMVLVHLGSQALKEGKTVVHYTLELADTVVGQRYDSCITGIPLNDLMMNKSEIFDQISDIEGNLIVKEYPTKSATTQSIKNHLDKLKKRGIHPDMVIVDYADLLRPVKARNEKRHELETLYEELRGIAQTMECPIWTASQTNRSGLNAEVITMEAISEAFNKCFVADFIFTVSRTIEDKKANMGRIFLAKNRNGPDGLVLPIFMDTANVCIKILEDQEELEHQRANPVENAKEHIKNKYSHLLSK
jgi:replicative DNA helicase